MEVKEQAVKIQNEMESLSDATFISGYNYFVKLSKLQGLYNNMQEIG
jgi:hypothetical protein